MRTDEDIIREYIHADRARRLNLYLQYRDLRSAFYRVDVKERHVAGEKIVETLPFDGEISVDRVPNRWRRILLQGFECRS